MHAVVSRGHGNSDGSWVQHDQVPQADGGSRSGDRRYRGLGHTRFCFNTLIFSEAWTGALGE